MYDLIGAETDLGVSIDGCEKAPKIILEQFKRKNKILISKPDVIKEKSKNNKAKNLNAIVDFNKKLYDQVVYSLKNNHFPITIGGDHSLAIASALADNDKNDVGIIWIDAHTDFNTFETTETGNIHGLPLAAICGLCPSLTNNLTNKFVDKKRVVIVGARSIDKGEQINLEKNNIKIFTTEDIKKYGVKKILDEAFLIAGNNVHISYDLDVIDPEYAMGVSVPEINGINIKEAYSIINYLKKQKNKIKAIDFVEYNPTFDNNEQTLNIVVNLINKFIKK